MPIYLVHTSISKTRLSTQKNFASAITNLHVQTFGGDPTAVRIDFLNKNLENVMHRHGGYGFKPKQGFMSVDANSDYITIQMDYRGSAEEWQDYCRSVVKVWTGNGDLRSIYLQRLEYEFEVEDSRDEGRLVVPGKSMMS